MKNQSFLQRNQILLKALLTGFLVLILIVPTFLVRGIITERQERKNEVINEVGQKWGLKQIINGPLIRVPYYKNVETINTKDQKLKEIKKVLTSRLFTAEQLGISSQLFPNSRKRGIFEVVVYESENTIKGHFKSLKTGFLDIEENDILWEKADLIIGISDLRGIKNGIKFNINGIHSDLVSEKIENFGDAIVCRLNMKESNKQALPYEIVFKLNGSEELNFTALGKTNNVDVKSSWPSPSFKGGFLPESHIINSKGFEAKWNISHLNRNLPEVWENESFPEFNNGQFGVSLINTNNNYQKSERSIKYAILVIALTFLAFFLVEIIKNQKVHPIQYLLIGLSLCIFYILLVSISEILKFNYAFLISSCMNIGLIYFYTKSIFTKNAISLLISAILMLQYSFIYIIIQLEDSALLFGSFGLFIILAITMYVSRKINWYLTPDSE